MSLKHDVDKSKFIQFTMSDSANFIFAIQIVSVECTLSFVYFGVSQPFRDCGWSEYKTMYHILDSKTNFNANTVGIQITDESSSQKIDIRLVLKCPLLALPL